MWFKDLITLIATQFQQYWHLWWQQYSIISTTRETFLKNQRKSPFTPQILGNECNSVLCSFGTFTMKKSHVSFNFWGFVLIAGCSNRNRQPGRNGAGTQCRPRLLWKWLQSYLEKTHAVGLTSTVYDLAISDACSKFTIFKLQRAWTIWQWWIIAGLSCRNSPLGFTELDEQMLWWLHVLFQTGISSALLISFAVPVTETFSKKMSWEGQEHGLAGSAFSWQVMAQSKTHALITSSNMSKRRSLGVALEQAKLHVLSLSDILGQDTSDTCKSWSHNLPRVSGPSFSSRCFVWSDFPVAVAGDFLQGSKALYVAAFLAEIYKTQISAREAATYSALFQYFRETEAQQASFSLAMGNMSKQRSLGVAQKVAAGTGKVACSFPFWYPWTRHQRHLQVVESQSSKGEWAIIFIQMFCLIWFSSCSCWRLSARKQSAVRGRFSRWNL